MAIFSGYVLAGADDYEVGDGASSTDTTLNPYDYNEGEQNRVGIAKIDTSSMDSGSTINSATLYWYHDSYTKSKSEVFTRIIQFYTTGSTYDAILSSSATPPAAGWHSQSIDSGDFAELEAYHNANDELQFRFSVGATSATYNRNWLIRSYEYDGSGGSSAYIVIDYSAASTPSTSRRRIFIIT